VLNYTAGKGSAVRFIAVFALALTLAGCAAYEQQQQEQAQAQAAAQNASDDAQCQSYGAAPGSPSYVSCRMNLDNQRASMRQMIAGQLVGNMMQPPTQNMNVTVSNCNVNPALCVGR
jgi:hypothetical protein